ncbi:hypothetical protein BDV93DRAFT_587670 [Ceratobasidium sp. AG-I]|nr:hypothetical protein BDV93DRAFT_587670 [Ceratobasidium sp. AG-I]
MYSSGEPASQESETTFDPESADDGAIRLVHPFRPNRLYERDVLLPPQSPKLPPPPAFTGAPWRPFRTLGDFEFANVALNANLQQSYVNDLLGLHQQSKESPVTLRNYQELRVHEDRATQLLTPFERVAFNVPYKPTNGTKKDMPFEVWVKPLREWLLELVGDESIQQNLQFDAQQKFRRKEGQWHRFVDEPWTTDEWARTQDSLPDDGLPLNIQLYADRAAISTFGSKKMYPVVARLTNLPREIRNSKGVGGGRVVALLPVVADDASESGRTAFADFKCAVWHAALEKLVESIRSAACVGHATHLKLSEQLGLDGSQWRLFPAISIISADNEEQRVCLTSVRSLFPCTRCMIPADQLHNLRFKARPRNPAIAAEIIRKAQRMNATQSEKLLKPYSYRPVKNVFLTLGPSTNPFAALSYDTLHNDDLGRWGKHLWVLLKTCVNNESSASIALFESRIDAVPSWPELNHFARPLTMEFSDGRKYEDLLKVVLHGTLGLDANLSTLVSLIRVQAELRVMASLDVHTDETVALGRELVDRFYDISQVCTFKYNKSFDFPKMHLLTHLFDDIWSKGVTANYSTKPSESMHGVLRKAYEASSKKTHSVNSEVSWTIVLQRPSNVSELLDITKEPFTDNLPAHSVPNRPMQSAPKHRTLQ